MPMRVLVCGGRDWTDGEAILRELERIHQETPITAVIEGEAPGADRLARQAADELGIPVVPFPADWKRYGRRAGPARNQQMVNEGQPDLVLAFHANAAPSKGTKDMIARAKKAGIPCRVFSSQPRLLP